MTLAPTKLGTKYSYRLIKTSSGDMLEQTAERFDKKSFKKYYIWANGTETTEQLSARLKKITDEYFSRHKFTKSTLL